MLVASLGRYGVLVVLLPLYQFNRLSQKAGVLVVTCTLQLQPPLVCGSTATS